MESTVILTGVKTIFPGRFDPEILACSAAQILKNYWSTRFFVLS